MQKNIKIKINSDLGKFKKDTLVTVAVDVNGVPIEKYWRSRLEDSKIDNCIEVLEEAEKSQEQNTKSNKKRVE